MNARRLNAASAAVYATAVVIFLGFGLLYLPTLGLQYDEVMFADHFWRPRDALWHWHIFGAQIPMMMMSYLGSLKTWLYAPLLRVAAGNVWTIRIPALLLAALTLLVCGRLLENIGGRLAGWIIALLLATDVTYLLTAVFDWGPVVIQNLLLSAGLLVLIQAFRADRSKGIGFAGFLFGLALWNKALFLWNLSAMGVAAVIVFLPELRRSLDGRTIMRFARGLAIGALPLIAFNVFRHGGTLSQNSHFDFASVPAKASYMMSALDGREAPPFLVETALPGIDQSARPFKRPVIRWAGHQSLDPSSWRFLPGVAIIILGLIAATNARRKWIAFFFLSGAIAWFESAITRDAGGSIHHTVLFWIPWYAAIALGAAEMAQPMPKIMRPAIAVGVVVLCVAGVRAEAIGYANLLRFAPKLAWSDADRALLVNLKTRHVGRVIAGDWGIAHVVTTESRHRIDTMDEGFALNDRHLDTVAFASCQPPACEVIGRPSAKTIFPTAGQNMYALLKQAGLQPAPPATIYDTHGYPAFTVFGVEPQPLPADVARSVGLTVTRVGPESPGGLAIANVQWTVPADKLVDVHVDSPSGKVLASSQGSGHARTGLWVKQGMQFYLVDRASQPAQTLAEVTALLH